MCGWRIETNPAALHSEERQNEGNLVRFRFAVFNIPELPEFQRGRLESNQEKQMKHLQRRVAQHHAG